MVSTSALSALPFFEIVVIFASSIGIRQSIERNSRDGINLFNIITLIFFIPIVVACSCGVFRFGSDILFDSNQLLPLGDTYSLSIRILAYQMHVFSFQICNFLAIGFCMSAFAIFIAFPQWTRSNIAKGLLIISALTCMSTFLYHTLITHSPSDVNPFYVDYYAPSFDSMWKSGSELPSRYLEALPKQVLVQIYPAVGIVSFTLVCIFKTIFPPPVSPKNNFSKAPFHGFLAIFSFVSSGIIRKFVLSSPDQCVSILKSELLCTTIFHPINMSHIALAFCTYFLSLMIVDGYSVFSGLESVNEKTISPSTAKKTT